MVGRDDNMTEQFKYDNFCWEGANTLKTACAQY